MVFFSRTFFTPNPNMQMRQKRSLLLFFLLIAGMIAFSQNQGPKKPYPIPSIRLTMSGKEAFKDYGSNGNTRERRELNIQTSTTSHGIIPNLTKVWVVKNNGAIVLGPYYVLDGQLLRVPVDFGSWGAIIKSNEEIVVNIWFTPF